MCWLFSIFYIVTFHHSLCCPDSLKYRDCALASYPLVGLGHGGAGWLKLKSRQECECLFYQHQHNHKTYLNLDLPPLTLTSVIPFYITPDISCDSLIAFPLHALSGQVIAFHHYFSLGSSAYPLVFINMPITFWIVSSYKVHS